jgi:RHS repeat-associated protein
MNRSAGTDTAKWLAVDHLGTPIAKFKSSTFDWRGGFEPFGADWNGAQAAGVFLRFPGQWLDEAWKDASLGAEIYYNVHRWYEHGVGRYGRVDPIPPGIYGYAGSDPIGSADALGLYKIRPQTNDTTTFGSPAYRPRRVEATFTCSCCGASWCLTFDIVVIGDYLWPPGHIKNCTREHEAHHRDIHVGWAREGAEETLAPAEGVRYNSAEACESAATSARQDFYDLLKRRLPTHNRRQSAYDWRRFVPDFFTCGPWSD